MALIIATVSCARSQDSLLSVSGRGVHVVFSTAFNENLDAEININFAFVIMTECVYSIALLQFFATKMQFIK